MPETLTNIWYGVVYMNRGKNGRGEAYWLGEGDEDLIKARFTKVVNARALIIARGSEVVWACIRQATLPRPQINILTAPIASLLKPDLTPYWDYVDTDQAGIKLEGETTGGEYNSRCLGFISDDEMTNGKWAREGFALPAVTPPYPVAPGSATRDELFAHALGTIRDNTLYASPLPGGTPAATLWATAPWARMFDGGLTTEKVGRKWHPFTWEAAQWTDAPEFSPCGVKFAVGRSGYVAPCRFYAGGPVQHIRWCFAKDDAAVFTGKTIFWPYEEETQFANSAGVGEFTGKSNRSWWLGFTLGDAPGLSPTGTPADFQGLSLKPWPDEEDTAEHDGAACDVSVFAFGVTDVNPTTYSDDNARELDLEGRAFLVTNGGTHKVVVDLQPLETRNELPVILAACTLRF